MRAHRGDSAALSGDAQRLYFACSLATSTSTFRSARAAASYCDFSIAVRRDVPVDEYVAALARELDVRFATRRAVDASTRSTSAAGRRRDSAAKASRACIEIVRAALHARRRRRGDARGESRTTSTPTPSRAWRDAGDQSAVARRAVVRRRRARVDAPHARRGGRSRAPSSTRARAGIDELVARPDLRAAGTRRARSGRATSTRRSRSSRRTSRSTDSPSSRTRRSAAGVTAATRRVAGGALRSRIPAAHDDARRAAASSTTRCRTSRARATVAPQLGVLAACRTSARSVGARVRRHERRWNVAPYAEWLRRRRCAGRIPIAGSETLDATRTDRARRCTSGCGRPTGCRLDDGRARARRSRGSMRAGHDSSRSAAC